MSAEDLGRRLLGGCVETTLEDVLKGLRTIESQEESLEELPECPLDNLLAVHPPQNQGRALRSPVLEISSEQIAAGKSQLIYYIIAQAVLPEIHDDAILDGKEAAVVVFDTNLDFDIRRLVQIMTTYIASKASENEPIEDTEELIERNLRHVHVYQPRSMTSLLEQLKGLDNYLFESTSHFSTERAVHSIIIDSASTYYWDTRAALENDRLAALDAKAPGASAASMPPPSPNSYALLVNRLRLLQQKLSCAVIATVSSTRFKHPKTGEETVTTLPAPWPTLPTARLMIRREQVKRFAEEASWEDAEKDRQLRQDAVEQGSFVATSDSGLIEPFKFSVTTEGVIMAGRKEAEQESDTEEEPTEEPADDAEHPQ